MQCRIPDEPAFLASKQGLAPFLASGLHHACKFVVALALVGHKVPRPRISIISTVRKIELWSLAIDDHNPIQHNRRGKKKIPRGPLSGH